MVKLLSALLFVPTVLAITCPSHMLKNYENDFCIPEKGAANQQDNFSIFYYENGQRMYWAK
jgi:hypothetical protein